MPTVATSLLGICLLLAGIADAWKGRVFDWITLPGVAGGLVVSYLVGGWEDGEYCLANSLLGFLIGFGVLFLFHLGKGVGGGDVKLGGAVGALGGYPFIVYSLFYSSLVGAVMAICMLIWEGRILSELGRGLGFMGRIFGRRRKQTPADTNIEKPRLTIRFGLAMALGTAWAWSMLYL